MGDCLIALCAEKVRAQYLVTRDESGFGDSAVEPISPDRLLERLEEGRGISYEWIEHL